MINLMFQSVKKTKQKKECSCKYVSGSQTLQAVDTDKGNILHKKVHTFLGSYQGIIK